MTMLDRMRRHRNWLKWSLALVVLAFVIFYIPAFLRPGDGSTAPTDTVAAVDRYQITVNEFRTAYLAQLAAYRNAYGGNVSETMLRQLGIERQLLAQLVDERAAVAEAERLGIRVTDQEVAERIYALPAFQEAGRFIGRARYIAMLEMQRPPVSAAEFEESLRRSLMTDKLRAALAAWIIVSDGEVEREHRRRTEQAKIDLVAFLADRFRDQVVVTDSDLSAHFEANKATYKVGEKRKVKYLLVDVEPIRAKVQVPSRDIERQYNDTIEMYSTPEQVRASHILFKTEGKQDDEVKARAEAVLKDVKAGKDFAELAKKYSEDEASAANGGDLDYFSRGRMVPEFDEVAFKLDAGAVSDLVRTQYGFHIIKVVDKKAATTKTLDEVRPQIQDQIAWERAQTRAADLASQLEREIRRPADLDKAAATHGLSVQESPLFARDEPIVGIGPSPEASTAAFELADGQVSGAVRVARGFAFLLVTGKQAPYTPKLDEVKEKVRADVVNLRALADAKAKAASAAAALRSAADFDKAAKAAGLEVKTTELLPRQSAWPEIGLSPEVDGAAFTMPVGTVSDPISTDRGSVVIRVVERKSPTPAEFAAAKDQLRAEMLNEAQGRFFSAYMTKAKQRMRISFNEASLKRVTG